MSKIIIGSGGADLLLPKHVSNKRILVNRQTGDKFVVCNNGETEVVLAPVFGRTISIPKQSLSQDTWELI